MMAGQNSRKRPSHRGQEPAKRKNIISWWNEKSSLQKKFWGGGILDVVLVLALCVTALWLGVRINEIGKLSEFVKNIGEVWSGIWQLFVAIVTVFGGGGVVVEKN